MTIKFHAKHKSGFIVDGPFSPFNFPAGEAHIKTTEDYDSFIGNYEYFVADVRGTDANDYIMAVMWAQAVRDAGGFSVLMVPYLPGARADRGVPNLQAYTNLVVDIQADQIIYLDPHSPVWVETFRESDDIARMTEFPVERVISSRIQKAEVGFSKYVGVIAPDKGAHDRAARAARKMGVPVYTAGKTRDFETGKLTGFHMEDELPTEGRFLIVDDICDGGGTFIGLAQAIGVGKERLDLWVSHGVFSKGVDSLLDEFGTIYTTNSFDHNLADRFPSGTESRVKVFDVFPYLSEAIDASPLVFPDGTLVEVETPVLPDSGAVESDDEHTIEPSA